MKYLPFDRVKPYNLPLSEPERGIALIPSLSVDLGRKLWLEVLNQSHPWASGLCLLHRSLKTHHFKRE